MIRPTLTNRPALAARIVSSALLAFGLGGCATDGPELRALDREIALERFMGDWFVVASIPIDVPFFSEAEAHDAVESYRLEPDGGIDITYTFRDGAFDGETRVMKQSGRVVEDGRGTEWRVQVFWPFESAYLIAWLDAGYRRAMAAVVTRRAIQAAIARANGDRVPIPASESTQGS